MNDDMIATWNTEVIGNPEVTFTLKQVLLTNAMIELCEQISRAYPLLPAEILVAYQDLEYRKFDQTLWVVYLYGLMTAIAQCGLDRLPKAIVKAYERAVEARNYGTTGVS